MRVGLQINRFDYPGGDASIHQHLKQIAQAAESAGFDSLWVMDHFFQLPGIGPYTDPMLEAYTALGYLAGVTQKVTLGTMVTGVIYREPAVLINAVTTLDVVSGGRAYFGIGAGWNNQEAIALGLLDPLHSRRFVRLEDTLKLALQMWSGDSKPFNGEIYKLPEPYLSPQSVTRPHPPILIGGSGEEKTLRFVAQYGDACNLFAQDKAQLQHKLQVLAKHCSDIGRDYNQIEKTCLAGVGITEAAMNQDGTLKTVVQLHELGIEHVIYAASKDGSVSSFEKFASTVQQIHELN